MNTTQPKSTRLMAWQPLLVPMAAGAVRAGGYSRPAADGAGTSGRRGCGRTGS